ncbi:MAG: radical SAM protein [Phycisphaerae bacterium]|jgi:radical SAM superfamily enzyme YgiQ (UPF0313 family)|nr:radical SAM protein [Phycisphaerae bacterium]MDP7286591.1 radical SAM protein [Phycisphaerae bacterium]
MKLLLVKPNIGRREHSLYVDQGRMEPLMLGLLGALAGPDVEVKLADDRCEAMPYEEQFDLVAITVETFSARRAYEISAEFRRRGRAVVLGGMHPTLLPEEASRHADAIVTSDAESIWGQLLDDARNGQLKPLYRGQCQARPQGDATPRRDLYRNKGYLPVTLSQFGRGCRFACNYCAISSYFNRQHYTRPVADVVREIEAQRRKLIFFVDDNIVATPERAKELFKALIPLRIRWMSQGSIDMTRDPELMALMADSGCLGNVIGFESITPQSLGEVGKTVNTHDFDRYERAINCLKDHGLMTWAAFTVGYDHDTRESLGELLDFALDHKFTFAAFNLLTPYPSTAFYDRLARAGRLLYGGRWWLHPDYRFNHAAFRPANMSPDELTEISFKMRGKFNSPGSIFRRFFDRRTHLRSLYNMVGYWTYNPLFRKEVFRKQGLRLGLAD